MVEELFNNENRIIPILISGVIVLLFMAVSLIAFFHFSRKKIVQKELEKKDLEISHQKKLLQATILTQEKERKRIAQDLHDDISSKLNIVSLNSHVLQNGNITEDELQEATGNIIAMTNKALESSRRIAHDLLPPILEKFGLKAAIEELCDEFESSKNVTVKLEMDSDLDHFSDTDQLNIFRILQELMNNSLRHGKAENITVHFYKENERLHCKYSDNGKGFDVQSTDSQKGLGMKNIESRIELLKGSINFKSAIDQGVHVHVTI
ncbi:sensor histidine kinase [Sungkyunkwania multivorans]|uniref:histidine kinase n=1 Tax=Sungkyunkwania multivorans TaxID=1173618 RepID=A0ABW3CYC7_9FLAO